MRRIRILRIAVVSLAGLVVLVVILLAPPVTVTVAVSSERRPRSATPGQGWLQPRKQVGAFNAIAEHHD